MKKNKILLALCGILTFGNIFSQDGEYITIRDFHTWTNVGVAYKLNKNIKFGLEGQLRTENNSSEIDKYLTELNVKYSIDKHFFLGAAFRFNRDNDNEGKIQGYENHSRIHFDFGYKHKLNDLSLKYRLRFQSKNEMGVSSEEGDFANMHLRLKTTAKYNIKGWKFDPIISGEIFRHYEKEETNGFNKFRVSVGTKYKAGKFGEIGLYYRIQKELNTTYPLTNNIVGLNYLYTIKKQKEE